MYICPVGRQRRQRPASRVMFTPATSLSKESQHQRVEVAHHCKRSAAIHPLFVTAYAAAVPPLSSRAKRGDPCPWTSWIAAPRPRPATRSPCHQTLFPLAVPVNHALTAINFIVILAALAADRLLEGECGGVHLVGNKGAMRDGDRIGEPVQRAILAVTLALEH